MRIPIYKLWSHEAYGPCITDNPIGMCPAEMPVDFASPEIVVTYLGYMQVNLQRFYSASVLGKGGGVH